MALIWHIIRKDLRRHLWILVFWALLFVAQVGLGLAVLRVDHPSLEWSQWLQWSNWLLVFLQFVTGYFLVTQFVQEDELIGTRMFWLTRPISTRRLLAAKTLGVLLVFAVVPVLLLLPWWLYCGFGARDLLEVAVETFGWQLLMIAPAFLIASLTDDLGRAIMWTLLLVAGLVAWTVWVQSGLKMALGVRVPNENSGVMFSRLWLAALILVAGTMIITVHQFLTRRWIRSATLFIPVLGLVALAGRYWSWDCTVLLVDLNRSEPPALAAPAAFASVQLTMGPAQVRYRDREMMTPNEQKSRKILRTGITESLKFTGVPEELVINGKASNQSWRWSDGSAPAPRSVYFGSWWDSALRKTLGVPARQNDPETMRWWEARRAKDNALRAERRLTPLAVPPRANGEPVLFGEAWLPDPLVERIQAERPASDLLFQAELSRLQIVLELPIKSGATASGDSQSFRITSVFRPWENNSASLSVVLTSPATRSQGFWGAAAIDAAKRDQLPQRLLAVNRIVGDYWGAHIRYDDGGEPVKARVGGVLIRWTICAVSSEQIMRDGKWQVRYPDWFEHASLVMVTSTPVARFTREVRTEKFELESPIPERTKSDKSF
jgi:hypothetical protein